MDRCYDCYQCSRENLAFSIDPSVPGDAFIDMDGSVEALCATQTIPQSCDDGLMVVTIMFQLSGSNMGHLFSAARLLTQASLCIHT